MMPTGCDRFSEASQVQSFLNDAVSCIFAVRAEYEKGSGHRKLRGES